MKKLELVRLVLVVSVLCIAKPLLSAQAELPQARIEELTDPKHLKFHKNLVCSRHFLEQNKAHTEMEKLFYEGCSVEKLGKELQVYGMLAGSTLVGHFSVLKKEQEPFKEEASIVFIALSPEFERAKVMQQFLEKFALSIKNKRVESISVTLPKEDSAEISLFTALGFAALNDSDVYKKKRLFIPSAVSRDLEELMSVYQRVYGSLTEMVGNDFYSEKKAVKDILDSALEVAKKRCEKSE